MTAKQKRKPTIRECDELLTAPGQVLEMIDEVIDGRTYRVWKNAPRTFRSFFLESLNKFHDRTFISAPTSTSATGPKRSSVTFGQVLARAQILAGWMGQRGLGVGSKVAIGGGNCVEWVITFVATHLIGGVAVCLNVWLPRDSLLHCIRVSKPDIIFIDLERSDLFKQLRTAAARTTIAETLCWSHLAQKQPRLITLDGKQEPLQVDMWSTSPYPEPAGLHPESDAVIFFSSGTSGPPKAVLSTQRMALTNLWSGLIAPSRAALRAGLQPPLMPQTAHPQKTVLLAIPLFHVTGCLSWLMRAFFGGSKMVMMRKWNTEEAVRLIMEEKVTVIGGVPAVVSAIVQSPSLPKEASFETVFYGGAPPSKLLAAEVKARWPKAGLVQGYGMTETNAYVCSVAGQDYVERPDSTGPAVPVADVKVIHPETRQGLAPGKAGLLLVRGPQVMKRYEGNPEATAAAVDPEGWLDTGDVAEIDQDGFVYIRDRLKDIIIRGGENITSSEVENALYAHPAVSEAIAIGLPHQQLGEVVGAAVSLREGHADKVNEEELMLSIKDRLPKFAWPVLISISPEPLPRNVNGKIVKKDLKPHLVALWEDRQAKASRGGMAKL